MWLPPVSFYHSGRESITSTDYRNDCRLNQTQPRVLIKHTLQGEGVLYSQGNRLAVSPGTVFIIERPGPFLYCYEGSGEPWEFEYISIQMNSKESLLPPWCLEHPVFFISEHPDLQKELSQMITTFTSSKNNALESSGNAYRLYLKLLHRFAENFEYSSDVRFIKEYIDCHFKDEILISKVCKELSKTPEAMIRKFKLETGISPGQYLLKIRIVAAKRLLKQKDLGLKEIGRFCGFNSLNYFIRVFKGSTGLTPNAYRSTPQLEF